MYRTSQIGRLLAGTLVAVLAAGLPATVGQAAPASNATASPAIGRHAPTTVTLITGDRITVRADDKIHIDRGAGRAGMQFVTRRVDGHLHVVPVDALDLLRAGRLDSRLFDVTTLIGSGYDDRRGDTPLIVSYTGDGARRAAGRAGGLPAGARVVRDLPAVGGQAVRADKATTTGVWSALTSVPAGARSLGAGIDRIWLDGKRKPTLDSSVKQIGAPAAWRAGLDGKGVTVAVLDTGIDAKHPDLTGQVAAAQNFTEGEYGEDALDRVGHGTHVASTIAGTGAASGGRYRGVASGARLLDGKVCVLGGCDESWILAGMQWAAESRAAVVNMSLAGRDTPDVDPLEQAVERLTARYGTLFVVAAGNDGEPQSVGSPASADAALAVGAVDKADKPAGFSSRGPRTGDDAIKPDVTAPGVDIVAARSADGVIDEPAPVAGYTTISGTSMATPHVAGAAAIIAQQHPDWKAEQLKATLTGSAEGAEGVDVFTQGAGRVDLARAITQTVTAVSGSVNFGRQSWPHDDDVPVTRTVTYRNTGPAAVTLALAVQASGPQGAEVPAGLFRLSAASVQVPAGAEASVTITADTRVAGPDGFHTGALVATAAGTRVRTPLAVNREVESYDLTLAHLDGTGAPAERYRTVLMNLATGVMTEVYDGGPTTTVRVPKGSYAVNSVILTGTEEDVTLTLLSRPRLVVDRAQRLVLDARAGRPVSVTVPRRDVDPALVSASVSYELGAESSAEFTVLSDAFEDLFTAQVGPARSYPGYSSKFGATMARTDAEGSMHNSPVVYHLSWFYSGRLFTGLRRTVTAGQLATVRETFARQADGVRGLRLAFPAHPESGGGWALHETFDLPFQRVQYANTDGGLRWEQIFGEEIPPVGEDIFPQQVSETASPPQAYRPGRSYTERWNVAVFGPTVAQPTWPEAWASRTGDTILAGVPLFGDGVGRVGGSTLTSARTTLYRNGTRVASVDEPFAEFTVPPAAAGYRLETTAERGAPHVLSTRVQAAWTFRSGHVAGEQPRRLPLSTVRFTPPVDQLNTAPAGQVVAVPVTVVRQPGSAAAPNRSLRVEVSYDDGRTWRRAVLRSTAGGSVAVLHHPAAAGFVSLRASATDRAGATVTQTVVRAYRTAIHR